MQFILDNVVALLVGGTVLVILLASQVRTGDAMVEHTGYYAAKGQSINLNEMVQADFENIGASVPSRTDIFTELTATAFAFRGQLNADDVTFSTIRYEQVATDTVMVDEEEVYLFELQRTVDGVDAGRSSPMMSEFVVELRDGAGNAVISWEDTESVYVQYVLMSYYKTDGFLTGTHWARSFHPPNL